MRFRVDEDLPRLTEALLRRYEHGAVDVRDIGLRGAKDPQIAAYARQLREQAQSRRRPTAYLRQCFHETVLKTEALFECQPP